MNREESEEILSLVGRLMRLTSVQSGREANATDSFMLPSQFKEQELIDAARKEIDRRAVRRNHLPSDMFSEGGWAMLLDLFLATGTGKDISIKSACIGSGLPETTALRHLGVMIERGLIERCRDQDDGRRAILTLSGSGGLAIRKTLAAMIDAERKAG